MKISLLQMDIAWNDVEANQLRCSNMVQHAVDQGAELAVLPEMFNTGFSLPVGQDAVFANRAGTELLCELSARYNLSIVGTLPDPGDDAAHPFNAQYVVQPSGIVAVYRKIHLFGMGGETARYRGGSAVIDVPIGGFSTRLAICYDLRFAPLFYQGAESISLYIVSANWPDSRQHHWSALLQARAIENLAFVAGVNRVGQGGGLSYAGGSQVVDPTGRILVHAGEAECVVTIDIDPALVIEARSRFPFLSDRCEIPGRA